MSQVPVYLLLSLPLVGAFAMLGLGVVVTYRASRVLNLAHGAMAMFPAYVTYSMSQAGLPAAAAIPLGVVFGALLGVLVERVFVRTLRRQGATAQTVGTVAALGLLLAFAVKIWGTTPKLAVAAFPAGGVRVGASMVRWGDFGLLAVAALDAAILFAFFRYAATGGAMRAAADNRRAAALVGIDPDFTTRLAWAIGGALAALAGILLAAVTVLHPVNLTLLVLPAFVAALIGGLESLPGVVVGATIVGVVQGMVPAIGLIPGVGSFATQVGAPQLVLALLAFVVMILRGERFVGGDVRADVAAPRSPRALRARGPASRARRVAVRVPLALAGLAALAWPLLGAPYSIVGDAIQACIYTIIAASLVLLTGWVGQISLAQAAFVGLGAFVSALLTNRLGVQFPWNLPVAALAAAAVAALLGVVALRVRGLYLAVATLIFLWMANEYLFASAWLVGPGGAARIDTETIGRQGSFPFFDFTEPRTFFYVAVAVAAATLWALSNLRDSKTGRAFFAVRGSETAAASLGIDVTRYKLLAFAASGFLAGVAGNLSLTSQGSASATQFGFKESLFFVSIAVVGGLDSLGGGVAAAVVFAGLTEVFFRVSAFAGWLDVVSAGLLASVLLGYPGGLGRIPASLGLARRRRDEAPTATPEPANRVAEAEAVAASTGDIVLEVEGLVVRFGGLTAVNGVAVRVHAGEIVGLIGPNGAGKTTIFNSISGLNIPTEGIVRLFGRDATAMPVHERAALGVARTFQVIQLFPQLSVFENLLVATHLRNETGMLSHMAVTKPSLVAERDARSRVLEIVRHLGLEAVAHQPVAGLPFGTLRMIELARALVTGAPLVMLDEPASGLDNTETEHLARVLQEVRRDLGVAILLIEHDVQMVTSICDRIYVIERGTPLADGTPEQIQRDARVVAAYLGEPAAAEPALV